MSKLVRRQGGKCSGEKESRGWRGVSRTRRDTENLRSGSKLCFTVRDRRLEGLSNSPPVSQSVSWRVGTEIQVDLTGRRDAFHSPPLTNRLFKLKAFCWLSPLKAELLIH